MSVLDPVYPTNSYVRAMLTGTSSYYDISAHVISTIHGEYGFQGVKYTDRVAPPGTLTFVLNNTDYRYLFGLASTLAGWQKGIRIQCSVEFDGEDTQVFSGFLKDCVPADPIFGLHTVAVTVTTWMDKATSFPLEKMQILTDARIGDGVEALTGLMPIPPANSDIDIGADVLPTIFDATQVGTVAITEFQRLALSEFGFIYERLANVSGETLVVESRARRSGGLAYATIPDNPTYLLSDPSGFILLQENGVPLLIDALEIPTQPAYMTVQVDSGNNILNDIGSRVYPRRIDVGVQTLFTLRKPIRILSGEVKTGIKTPYVDPNGGGTKVNADPSTMIPLVKNTDYKMYLNEDATGTDLTNALILNYDFGSEATTFNTITNTGTVDGWITTLNTRGYGIYFYEPVDYYHLNTGSVQQIGTYALKLEQKYQSQIDTGIAIVDALIDRESESRTCIRKMTFNANTNYANMRCFTHLDIGDLVSLASDNPSLSGDYNIHRKEFDIRLGGTIDYSYEFLEFLPLSEQYWQLETVGFSELDLTTYVGL